MSDDQITSRLRRDAQRVAEQHERYEEVRSREQIAAAALLDQMVGAVFPVLSMLCSPVVALVSEDPERVTDWNGMRVARDRDASLYLCDDACLRCVRWSQGATCAVVTEYEVTRQCIKEWGLEIVEHVARELAAALRQQLVSEDSRVIQEMRDRAERLEAIARLVRG